VFQRLPKGCCPEGEQPIELEFSHEKLTYSEGDILSVTDPSAGSACSSSCPPSTAPLLYTSTCFWMSGKVSPSAWGAPEP
jgi:hypothetical protein